MQHYSTHTRNPLIHSTFHLIVDAAALVQLSRGVVRLSLASKKAAVVHLRIRKSHHDPGDDSPV